MSNVGKLVIVQDVPTQFDMPLYNRIAGQDEFELAVFYTKDVARDPETGCLPHWDHVKSHDYQHQFLSKQECRLKNLFNLIVNECPQHVIICGYWPKLYRDLARKLKSHGISIGLRSDNTLQHSRLSGLRGWLKIRYLAKWLRIYDYWHPVGTLASDYLRSIAEFENKTVLFPYNVDNDWFRSQSKDARENRSKLFGEIGFSNDSYVLLGIMKWNEREDPMTLVRAFKELRKTFPKLNLILAGDGPMRAQIHDQLEGVEGVYLPGYLPYSKLPEMYAIADLFIHPAPGESWGVSVNEALASGLPVITSDRVGAGIELIQDGETGAFFEAGDAQALARAINRWIQISLDFDLQELREACFKSLQQWNYQTTVESFNKVLSEASRK